MMSEDTFEIVQLTPEQTTGAKVFDAATRGEIAAAARQDSLAKVLQRRRFELLPPTGIGAPFTEAQGRDPGDMTTPAELSDLIASISTMGVLQPILVEERTNEDGTLVRLVVAGERRLRAVRWGNTHRPDNPHFKQIPAVICPGPLSDEDKRSWQLVENLAREELKPGELAAALMFERCAILVTKLVSHAIPVPKSVLALDNPIERFEALEKLRGKNTAAAAPWEEVFQRLGLQMSPRKARALVAAFKALPSHLTDEMDEAHIALHTRIKFIELRRGRQEAADEIWAAVKAKQNGKLLSAAVSISEQNPNVTADEAVQRAEESAEAVNAARRAALVTHSAAPTAAEAYDAISEAETDDPASTGWGDLASDDDTDEPTYSQPPTMDVQPLAPVPEPTTAPPVDPEIVADTLTALRSITSALADGASLNKYDAGSMRLLAQSLIKHLQHGNA